MSIVKEFLEIVKELREAYPEIGETTLLDIAGVLQRNEIEQEKNLLYHQAHVLGTEEPSALEAIAMALREVNHYQE